MSSFFSYPMGPIPGRTIPSGHISNFSQQLTSSSSSSSLSHTGHIDSIKHPLPNYVHYGVKPAVGAVSGYLISNYLLYPGVTFGFKGTEISRGAFVGAAVFAGLLAAEFFKDKFLDGLPKGISTFGTAATDIGIVFGIDYFAHILMDPSVAQDLSYTKVAMEAAGSVLLASYLTNQFILPWMGYEMAK